VVSGRAGAVNQLVEVGEPGSGPAVFSFLAQEPHRAVQLGHRAAAEVGDRVGLLAHALVGRSERLRLHDHQRDVVADRITELARDPQPLLGRRAVGEQLTLALRVAATSAVVEAERGGGERQRRGRHVGRGRLVITPDQGLDATAATTAAVPPTAVRHEPARAM
jgi:hypothetical protein